MDRSDEALIAAHLNGDRTAFAELVRRHAEPILGYLMRMTGNRHQAEDLFQETFKTVHMRAKTFRGDGLFRNWLFAIASRIALGELRSRRRRPTLVPLDPGIDCDPPSSNPSGDPPQSVILSERREQVQQALIDLPIRQRATLILRYYQGLSYREVADALGCTQGTVKRQMARALQTLAHRLRDGQDNRQ